MTDYDGYDHDADIAGDEMDIVDIDNIDDVCYEYEQSMMADEIAAPTTTEEATYDVAARPETLDEGFCQTVPQFPCWQCVVVWGSDSDDGSMGSVNPRGLTYPITIRLTEKPGSTIIPNRREEWPVCYVGGTAAGAEDTEIVEGWLAKVNKHLEKWGDTIGQMSEWEFENWCNTTYCKVGFWSSRVEPMEAMQPSRAKRAVGSKPRNRTMKGNMEHLTAKKVIRAYGNSPTSLMASQRLDEEHEHHDENLVGKAGQADVGVSIDQSFELNSVKVENDSEERLTNKEWNAREARRRQHIKDTREREKAAKKLAATVNAPDIKELCVLPYPMAREMCGWAQRTHLVHLQMLPTHEMRNGEEMCIVYRPLKLAAKQTRSIVAKATAATKRYKAGLIKHDMASKDGMKDAEKDASKTRCADKKEADKKGRDAAFARNVAKRDGDTAEARKYAACDPLGSQAHLAEKTAKPVADMVHAACEPLGSQAHPDLKSAVEKLDHDDQKIIADILADGLTETGEKLSDEDKDVIASIIAEDNKRMAERQKANDPCRLTFDAPVNGGLIGYDMVVQDDGKFAFRDSVHAGGPWSNVADFVDDDGITAAFRKALVKAATKLEEQSGVYMES